MDKGIKMSLRLGHVIAVIILHLQMQQSESRYCQEAVDSAKNVTSCPTSKAEWDDAARWKNCSSIASKQNCSPAENFQYHCVINEFRNELLEVCAPSRFIFGSCVEFNVAGGVIQDQWSAPCNETFPKCDTNYPSRNAYLYPDCYQLVFNSKMISTTITTTESPSLHISSIIIIAVIWLFSTFTSILSFMMCGRTLRKLALQVKNKHKNMKSNTTERRRLTQICEEFEDAFDARSDDFVVLQPDSDNMCYPQLPTRNISPSPSFIQSASSGSTIYEDAPNAKSDDPNVMQPIFDQRKDASDKESEELSTVQSDSDKMCDPGLPTRNISPAPSFIQSASSGSTIYEDASDARSDDPDVLQPNSDKKKDASDHQSEELSTVQSDSDDTQEEHRLENGSPVMKEEMP